MMDEQLPFGGSPLPRRAFSEPDLGLRATASNRRGEGGSRAKKCDNSGIQDILFHDNATPSAEAR